MTDPKHDPTMTVMFLVYFAVIALLALALRVWR